MGRTWNPKKTKQIAIRLPEPEKSAMEAHAKVAGYDNVSDWARSVLRADLAGAAVDPVAQWLYRLYMATAPGMRGSFRTLADRIGFTEQPPREMFDEGERKGEIPQAANEAVRRKPAGRRGV